MRKAALFFLLIFCAVTVSYAAPCYGTRMPQKNQFFAGVQIAATSKRYLEDGYGKLRSRQEFLNVSYGVLDWLSIDLKGGAGNIKQHPLGSDEVDYPSAFAGGYGFRLKLYDKEGAKMAFGFQHISVHPENIDLGVVRNKAILDDWQVSILVSRDFLKTTSYLGARWSRVDYIHRAATDRVRRMSDLTKAIGFVFGLDIPVTQKIWVNLEGQLFDSEAIAFSLNREF